MQPAPAHAANACLRAAALLAGLSAAALSAGCAQPAVAWQQPVLQQSATNVRNWRDIANSAVISMQIKGALPTPDHPAQASGLPLPGPYYVHVVSQGSTFLEEMRIGIEQQLQERGLQIARAPGGATVLNLDVDVVTWSALRPFPGVLPLAAAAVGDAFVGAYPTPDSEAAWTVTAYRGDRMVMKCSDVIYIDTGDIPLYRGSVTLAALASPGTSELGVTRRIRYAQ
jgi:hypothetical protein